MKGVIKWFNEMTGYGIIEAKQSNFTFKICSNGNEIEHIKEGERILFKLDNKDNINSSINGLYINNKNNKTNKTDFILAPLN